MSGSEHKSFALPKAEKEKVVATINAAEKPEHPIALKYTGSGRIIGSPYNVLCPGCGYGNIAMAICEVLGESEANETIKYPIVIGIGCYSSLPLILPLRHTLSTLHGRTLPVATGIKLSNPHMKPIVLTGDGDCLAIGAGHFINACRRNLDVVVIMLNNSVYGMTGGHLAPTSSIGQLASTAPYGCIEKPFDAVELAIASGATYVSRWTSIHIREFMHTLKKALEHKGFSFIELMSTCPSSFGKRNGFNEPIDLMRHLRDRAIRLNKAKNMTPEGLKDKIVIGEFKDELHSELSDSYRKMINIVLGNTHENRD